MIGKSFAKGFIEGTSRVLVIRAGLDLAFAIFLSFIQYFQFIPPNSFASRLLGLVLFVLYVTSLAFIALAIQKFQSEKNLKKLEEDINKLKQS